jgi:hypothetical protein
MAGMTLAITAASHLPDDPGSQVYRKSSGSEDERADPNPVAGGGRSRPTLGQRCDL